MKSVQEKTFEILENTGLNWSVKKEALQSISGKPTGSNGIFRNDNGLWLGTVGDRYETFQNSEMVEMIVQASEGIGLSTNRGGMLFNGKKVYVQMTLPDEFVGKSNVKRHLTALNSHDGTSSIGFGSANTVVVCQNTFFKAYGEVEKIRHTQSMKARVENAIKSLRIALGLDEKLMVNYKRMADEQLNDEIVMRVVKKIFNADIDAKQSEVSTRKQNLIKSFSDSVEKSIEEQGKTIWALFNGVTRYYNHVSAPEGEDRKVEYLYSANGARYSNMAFDTIMQYIEENTAELVPVLK